MNDEAQIGDIILYSMLSNYSEKLKTYVFAKIIQLKPRLIVNDIKASDDGLGLSDGYWMSKDATIIGTSPRIYEEGMTCTLDYPAMFPQYYI